MKKKNPWLMLLVLLLVFGGFLTLIAVLTVKPFFKDRGLTMSSKSILHLKLTGVIMDGKKVLKPLIKYRDDNSIKAVVIEINSPGGVVGPSQELYEEIKRVREEYKKPVVAVSTAVMASGAYYAAVAADKILVAPGTMVGSIGVIMEFTNLEKLYDWAKVSRFSISTGKFKDSGAEYRPMREDERALFQDLINDVYEQFVAAVAEGRELKPEFVKEYADGRVFTGRKATELGFADDVGTVEDAFDLAAELSGLGDDYDVFEPPKVRPSLWDLISSGDDEEATTLLPWKSADNKLNEALKSVLRIELSNKPLLLMPGVY
ncbi:MAG: signal peptide peptidase SppA [Bdellovibrio sp.]|jgi:protease-4